MKYPTLTKKLLQRRHEQNPQDAELHKEIESKEVPENFLKRLLKKNPNLLLIKKKK